ncbi:MAG: hypothetical protein AAB823_00655 [Patescibacteria group bacterium]
MKKLYLGVLLSAVIIFFWRTLFSGLIPIPADALVGLYHPYRDYYAVNFPNGVPFKNYILTDPVLQQYPWKWLVMNDWRKGLIPLENPYSFSGTPLLANIQAGVFYPLNILFILISSFPTAWAIFIIIQPLLASIFMSWWLENNGIRRMAALFGGLVWAFSSFNLVWLEWGNIGHAGLYLPLALLAVDNLQKSMSRKQKIMKWHALLQFSLANSLFAGHFQVTFYLLAAVGLYWFIRLGISKRSFSLFIIHYSLFILITSPQWFPSLKFTLQSNRSVEQANVLSREGFFIRPRQLVQLIVPDFFGNPSTLNYRGSWNYAEQIIYIGLLPLVLSVIPFSSSMLFTPSIFFPVILVILGVIFSVDSSISRLPYQLRLPLISDLQPTRLSYLITFGLSTLSAFGLNEFIKHPRKLLSKIMTIFAIFAILLFALLVISSKFSPDAKLVSQRNLIFPFATLGLGVLISGSLWIVPKKNYSLLSTFYLLFSILGLIRFGWKFTPFSSKEYLYPVTPAIKFLQENMGINDRYMTLDRRLLPPNANIMYKLKSIEGYDPIYSKDYAVKIAAMENGDETIPDYGRIIRPTNFNSPIAGELNVKYVLSLIDIKDQNLEKVFQEGETRIYESTGK